MILKQMYLDDGTPARVRTRWTAGVIGAELGYDEDWQGMVLTVRFKGDKEPLRLLVRDGDGLFLCGDEGKTIEVLSRLHVPVQT